MDGVHQVRARIAAIEQQLRTVQPRATTVDASGQQFDRVLGTALARTPATQRAPGAYGPMEVPSELSVHRNGELPAGALSQIGVGSHRLSHRAAAAFREMHADAARDGVDIGVTDSYRSLPEQVDLAERKGLYSQGGLAATPGTSNHGWGLALDVDVDDRGQQWLRANGAKYGFVEDVAREPWHWTYRPD
jgi:hypothetical protein